MSGEGQRFQLGTIGALSLSVVSSVSIVICNKALISTLGFTFGELSIFQICQCYRACGFCFILLSYYVIHLV